MASLWYWNVILIGFMSIFYILKIHKFYGIDLLVAIAFGIVSSIGSGFNPIITTITVLSYYSGCCIFKKYKLHENIYVPNLKYNLKTIVLGVLIGVLPALFNLIEFYIKDGFQFAPFSFSRIIPSMIGALQPGICEEIVFRFFLYAFIINCFKGELPKTKLASILTYILLIFPHCIIHYQAIEFINKPIETTLNFIYMFSVFGIPAVWLLKNKTLYSAIAFHWFIDFIRFLIVGH